MPVGVIGSRQAWAGEPITIILISDRQHIGGWPNVFLCLTRHLFLCLVCVLGLGGVATECGCWRNLPPPNFS